MRTHHRPSAPARARGRRQACADSRRFQGRRLCCTSPASRRAAGRQAQGGRPSCHTPTSAVRSLATERAQGRADRGAQHDSRRQGDHRAGAVVCMLVHHPHAIAGRTQARRAAAIGPGSARAQARASGTSQRLTGRNAQCRPERAQARRASGWLCAAGRRHSALQSIAKPRTIKPPPQPSAALAPKKVQLTWRSVYRHACTAGREQDRADSARQGTCRVMAR